MATSSSPQKHRYVVIMAGGGGTRLWPLSRQAKPKQFLKLTGEETLLQRVYDDVRQVVPNDQICIMADAARAELAREQLPQLKPENVFIEPSGRDNGPAIALATLLLEQRDPGCQVAIIWSDHSIEHQDRFKSCLGSAFDALKTHPQSLITVGIKPTRAATEYGYIKMSHELELNLSEPIYSVERFEEKPDAKTAAEYVEDWRYLWNTGYKIFQASQMLALFREHQPAFSRLFDQIKDRLKEAPNSPFVDLWEQLEKKDIERLITEKTKDILVIPADLGWSDVGSWDILYNIMSNQTGDDLVARAEHIDVGSRRCLIMSEHRLIATAGLDNLIIIDTPDALLVIDKDHSQEVKQLVNQLKERNLPLL